MRNKPRTKAQIEVSLQAATRERNEAIAIATECAAVLQQIVGAGPNNLHREIREARGRLAQLNREIDIRAIREAGL